MNSRQIVKELVQQVMKIAEGYGKAFEPGDKVIDTDNNPGVVVNAKNNAGMYQVKFDRGTILIHHSNLHPDPDSTDPDAQMYWKNSPSARARLGR